MDSEPRIRAAQAAIRRAAAEGHQHQERQQTQVDTIGNSTDHITSHQEEEIVVHHREDEPEESEVTEGVVSRKRPSSTTSHDDLNVGLTITDVTSSTDWSASDPPVRKRRRRSAPEQPVVVDLCGDDSADGRLGLQISPDDSFGPEGGVEIVEMSSLSQGSGQPGSMVQMARDAALARALQEEEQQISSSGRATRKRTQERKEEQRLQRESGGVLPPSNKPDPVVATFPRDRESGQPLPGAVSLRQSDLALLNPGLQLNDSIIEFYLRYLHICTLNSDARFHMFSPFFFSSLRSGGIDRVRRWLPRDIFDRQYWIVPINDREHWKLVVVCRVKTALERAVVASNGGASASSQPKRPLSLSLSLSLSSDDSASAGTPPVSLRDDPCIVMFDSLGTEYLRVFTTLRRFAVEEYNHRSGTSLKAFGPKSLEGVSVNAPAQPNDYDCGVFLLHYAEKFCRDPSIDVRKIGPSWFDVDDINEKRVYIFTIIDRLRAKHNAQYSSLDS